MAWQVTIDNGSTFTDGCLITESGMWSVKVLTTPYDLMRCFTGVFRALAEASGVGGEAELLKRVAEVRYSTTAGTNALLVKRGARVGMVTSPEAERDAYGLRELAPELVESIVGDRVRGLQMGNGSAETQDRLITTTLRELLGRGAEWIVVSFPDPWGRQAEVEFKRRYMRLFPGHLLGSIPILFSRELCEDPDDRRRTATALLNAFLHRETARFLYHADRWTQERHVYAPLHVMRNDWGCGRVAKTTGVKTLDSGPVGGLSSAGLLARLVGQKKVVTVDVGGTSADIGLVENFVPKTELFGQVHGLPLAFSFPKLRTAALGGGSIFTVSERNFKIGPESAGALPGPVCFGRGGEQPTLTDAALLAGFIDATTFAGGQFRLNPELADAAITKKIAEPLGLNGASAGASAMIETFAERLANEIGTVIKHAGWEPHQTTLLLYGGSGPLLATLVGDRLGVGEVLIPHAAASFSALGVAFCELAHGYRAIVPADVTQETLDGEILPDLERRAKRDMFGEGVAEADCAAQLRLWQGGEMSAAQDAGAGALKLKRGGAKGPVVVDLRLSKRGSGLQAFPAGHKAPRQSALQAKRRVLLKGEPYSVQVMDVAGIAPGASGEGPCVIEAGYWSSVIVPKWKWSMAEWGFRIFK